MVWLSIQCICSLNSLSQFWGSLHKDLDLPKLSRDYGTRDVGLLLAPAFDFDVDG